MKQHFWLPPFRFAFYFVLSLCGIVAGGIDYYYHTAEPPHRAKIDLFLKHTFFTSRITPVPQNCSSVPDGTVDIVFITDKKYIRTARTAIYSATVNKCPQTKYAIRVLTRDLTEEQKQSFKKLETDTVSIETLAVEKIPLNAKMHSAYHVSSASLNKINMAEYLPSLDKVLYLDADILVMRDLMPLFKTDLGNAYFAAVRKNEMHKVADNFVPDLTRTRPPYDFPYFNAGVMLMNLNVMRQENVGEKTLNFRYKHYIDWSMDQEAFNAVSVGRVLFLPYKYNVMTHTFTTQNMENSQKRRSLNREYAATAGNEIPETPEEIYNTATIIHYIASPKIWETKKDAFPRWNVLKPLRALWFSYAREAKQKVYGR